MSATVKGLVVRWSRRWGLSLATTRRVFLLSSSPRPSSLPMMSLAVALALWPFPHLDSSA